MTRWTGRVLLAALATALPCGCASRQATDAILVPGATLAEDRTVTIERSWVPEALAALRSSPGCLGADAGQVGRKRAVFAMFRDKASAVAWYRSGLHQSLVGKVSFYRDHEHDPLAKVPDGTGPILVIASMQARDPQKGFSSPQLLAVELFTPLDAGVRFGGASFLPLTDAASGATDSSAGGTPIGGATGGAK